MNDLTVVSLWAGSGQRSIPHGMATSTRARLPRCSVREEAPLLRCHLCIKCIVLPRQARDKHRESTPKQRVVAFFLGVCDEPCARKKWIALSAGANLVRKTASFFECFPYVCPDPVLAKWSFLCINGSKMPFFSQGGPVCGVPGCTDGGGNATTSGVDDHDDAAGGGSVPAVVSGAVLPWPELGAPKADWVGGNRPPL
jgi:hypothetical protein